MAHRLISHRFVIAVLIVILALGLVPLPLAAGQQSGNPFPPAPIVNDEGGPVHITGNVTYTNTFFTDGVAEPLVILEDQTGFVTRNRGYLMPLASQVMGQITSDFYTSPFTYSVSLPEVPDAPLNDVDNNGQKNPGVMVYAVAYWTNIWGDPFLGRRDLGGGGWSSCYASTRVDTNPSAKNNVIGGTYLIYAPDDQEGFPSDWGTDGQLFTSDDPIVGVPQGYTIVNMDTSPFTFSRPREATVNLIECAAAVADDFSSMSYTDAFDAMIELFRTEYAYTDYKHIDWDAESAKFRPMFEQAQANNDNTAYQWAMEQFIWSIPDGHLYTSAFDQNRFVHDTAGGLGMAIRDLDDGRTIVNFLTSGGPAEQAGIQLRAQIISINDTPINDFVNAVVPWSGPFSTEWTRRLQQLRYAMRFALGTDVSVTYQNPGDTQPTTVNLTAANERDSFVFSSFAAGLTGTELPLEYSLLDNGDMYVKVYSFFDNELLTIQLWERMLHYVIDNNVPGLIIDMRQNGGGNGFLAAQMAAYFFDDELDLGNTAMYDKSTGKFEIDKDQELKFYPPSDNLRYHGPVAVLVGPSCASACEHFSRDMTLQNRAQIVGMYPSAGLAAGQKQFFMPDGVLVQMSVGRTVDANGDIIIEGVGVVPTVKVPVTEDTLFSTTDPVVDAAVAALNKPGTSQ
jgi:C-terminal processing protease CtpA/Prc